MPNINVQADYFFPKNVGLYINSQQTINRPYTDLLLLWSMQKNRTATADVTQ